MVTVVTPTKLVPVMTKVVPAQPCVIAVVPSLVKLVIVGSLEDTLVVRFKVAVLQPVT